MATVAPGDLLETPRTAVSTVWDSAPSTTDAGWFAAGLAAWASGFGLFTLLTAFTGLFSALTAAPALGF